eukprot:4616462-Pyramimonas_sp.AAC.1
MHANSPNTLPSISIWRSPVPSGHSKVLVPPAANCQGQWLTQGRAKSSTLASSGPGGALNS